MRATRTCQICLASVQNLPLAANISCCLWAEVVVSGLGASKGYAFLGVCESDNKIPSTLMPIVKARHKAMQHKYLFACVVQSLQGNDKTSICIM